MVYGLPATYPVVHCVKLWYLGQGSPDLLRILLRRNMLAPASIRVAAHFRLLCTCHLSTTCDPVDTVNVELAETKLELVRLSSMAYARMLSSVAMIKSGPSNSKC
jgi:hypothetical protein